jgi:hypothetical protein
MGIQTVSQALDYEGRGSPYGFKNRIINGAMVIDQRNAGASVTPTAGQYSVDRWQCSLSQTSKYTIQQSTTVPSGFKNSIVVTSSSSYSITSGDYFNVSQPIEGLNIADLNWGTASAATITLSFWVRSSLTGTFGGVIQNSALDRSYPFTYTINSANTWEQKSITIAGDTSGTWLTTNGVGIYLRFGLGVGTTYSGTAGSWAATNYASATGATSVVGTNGATFYITGVQLERGTQATAFDWRPYGTELALCQRYFQYAGGYNGRLYGYAYTTTSLSVIYNALVTFRTSPSIALSTTSMLIESVPWSTIVTGSGCTANAGHVAPQQFDFLITGFTGLTVNQPATVYSGIYFSAEL